MNMMMKLKKIMKKMMKIEIDEAERGYLLDILKGKQIDYKALNIKTGTIDGIIDKLSRSEEKPDGLIIGVRIC